MRTSEESQVPTTILALPNLFAEDFLEWHSFTEALADDLEVGGVCVCVCVCVCVIDMYVWIWM